MRQRSFPRHGDLSRSGCRVVDANGLALAHVYDPRMPSPSDKRLTDNEAEKLARLVAKHHLGSFGWLPPRG
jgi:hypothetical protein